MTQEKWGHPRVLSHSVHWWATHSQPHPKPSIKCLFPVVEEIVLTAGSERPPYAHEWVFLAHFIAFGETHVKLYVAETRKPLALHVLSGSFSLLNN